MDCIVHGIAKSLTRLSNFHFVLSTSYPGDILGIFIQYYLGSLLLLFNHSSCLNSFAKPWNIACQACLSMGFSRHEYQNGLLFPSPEDLPDTKIKFASPSLTGRLFNTEPPAHKSIHILQEYKQKGNLNALEWWVFERRQMKNGYGNKRG